MVFSGEVDSFPRVRSLGKIFLYAIVVLLVGSLVAPWAWLAIQHTPSGLFHGLIGSVQGMPFHRYLSRSIQVTAIVLLWPLLRWMRVRSLEELGLFPNLRPWKDLLTGLAAGIPSALVLVLAALSSGAFELHSGWSPTVLPKIAMTAVVVALLEEFLFRGIILGFFRQFLSGWMAVIISALIFATLHFLNLPTSGSASVIPSWSSGLFSLFTLKDSLPPLPMLAWAFATLLTAGILLGWMTTRTASLWSSVGLHASWVFAQQLFSNIAAYRDLPSEAFLPYIGPAQCHGAVPVGLEPLLCLLLAAVVAASLLRGRPLPRVYFRVSW
jgi:membrane protease YdiL (CAAX protease family)